MEALHSREYFNKVASEWDEMGDGYFGDTPRNCIHGAIDILPGETVVDVGCGTGYLMEGLDLDNIRMIAVDQSEIMLNKLKNKFADYDIDLRVGESEHLPLENDSADLVMANMYIHHVENPQVAISEMARILRPGGKLIFIDMDSHNYTFLMTEQHDRWMGFDRSDIQNWLKEAGLTDLSVDGVGTSCCAESSCGNERAEITLFVAKATKPKISI